MLTKLIGSRLGPDTTSTVIGDGRYEEHASPSGLTLQVLGPYVRGRIHVSRYYRWVAPPVIVDFEPARADGPMHCDVKRRWCHAQGIVYLPIFLRERLTAEQLRERLAIEREALQQARGHAADDQVLDDARTAAPVVTEEDQSYQQAVDQEALLRLEAEAGRGKLHPRVRAARLRRLRAEVEREFRERLKDGSLGHLLSYQQPAVNSR